MPSQVDSARAGRTHVHRRVLPGGLRPMPPPKRLSVLLWLKGPHHAPGGKLGPGGFHSVKTGLNYARSEWDPCDLGPPELEPPSPGRHPRPPVLGVHKRHSPAAHLGPGEQVQAPWQEPGEATGATGARAGDYPGGSLGAQAPSLAGGVPTPSLDPRRTPASRDKQPSASMGLGHQGPGCEQLACGAANPQTPPSRPHHCEDPPVLPSVTQSPFTDGRTGGRPPGDGFCPSRGWLVSGLDLAAHPHSGSPTTSHPRVT